MAKEETGPSNAPSPHIIEQYKKLVAFLYENTEIDTPDADCEEHIVWISGVKKLLKEKENE